VVAGVGQLQKQVDNLDGLRPAGQVHLVEVAGSLITVVAGDDFVDESW